MVGDSTAWHHYCATVEKGIACDSPCTSAGESCGTGKFCDYSDGDTGTCKECSTFNDAAACPGANTTDTGEYACANCCFLSEEDAAGGHIWVEESGSDESESEAEDGDDVDDEHQQPVWPPTSPPLTTTHGRLTLVRGYLKRKSTRNLEDGGPPRWALRWLEVDAPDGCGDAALHVPAEFLTSFRSGL